MSAGRVDSDALIYVPDHEQARIRVQDSNAIVTPSGSPLFEIRGTMVFRSPWHPDGPSDHPMYEIRGGRLFATAWNDGA